MKRKRLHGTPELLGRGGLQKLAQLVDMLRLEVEQIFNVFDAVLGIERPEQVATLDGAEPGSEVTHGLCPQCSVRRDQ